jgi:hypothetical protein
MSEQYISKGQYTYTQQSGYVTVKNYIFLEKNGKKCLILRFSNDSAGVEFNEMRFTVVEKDPAGQVIKRTRVEWRGLKFAPGTTYVNEDAIVVDDLCVDFKIEPECLISGQYRYVFDHSGVRVDFIPSEKKSTDEIDDADRIYVNSVSRKQYGKPKLAGLVAFVAILLIFAVAAVGIVSRYKAAEGEQGTSVSENGIIEFSTGMNYEIITAEDGSFIKFEGVDGSFEFYTGMNYEIITSENGFSFEGFEGYYEYVTVYPTN